MAREREYPPTPYPPRSPETAAYREGWDSGYEFVGRQGARQALLAWIDNGWWLSDGPSHRGFEDGARARLARQLRAAAAETDPAIIAEEQRSAELQRRAEVLREKPY